MRKEQVPESETPFVADWGMGRLPFPNRGLYGTIIDLGSRTGCPRMAGILEKPRDGQNVTVFLPATIDRDVVSTHLPGAGWMAAMNRCAWGLVDAKKRVVGLSEEVPSGAIGQERLLGAVRSIFPESLMVTIGDARIPGISECVEVGFGMPQSDLKSGDTVRASVYAAFQEHGIISLPLNPRYLSTEMLPKLPEFT
jgi:hypothetical protein